MKDAFFWERWKGAIINEKDLTEKNFIALNDVFADIFNVLIFEGREVVTQESLEDIMAISQYKADDSNLHEQERDVYKLWKGHGINFVITGIENQTKLNRDMPFRIVSYDGASYRSQLLKREERLVKGVKKNLPVKERYPVVTIVLYFGKEPWKYPLELKDCFRPKLSKNKITELLDPYISNYKVNLFDIPRLPYEKVKLFKSDFRIVAEYFVNRYSNPGYVPESATIKHVDEFLKLMRILTGDRRYEKVTFSEVEKKEGVQMCEVLDFRENRGKEVGKRIGEEIGENHILQLMQILAEKGYQVNEVLAMLSQEEQRKQLYKEYGII